MNNSNPSRTSRLIERLRGPSRWLFRTPIAGFAIITLLAWSWKLGLLLTALMCVGVLGQALALHWFRLGIKGFRFYGLVSFADPVKPVSNYLQVGYVSLASLVSGVAATMLVLAAYTLWPSRVLAYLTAICAAFNLLNGAPIVMSQGGAVWAAIISRFTPATQWVLMLGPLAIAALALIKYQAWGLLLFLILWLELSVVMLLKQGAKADQFEDVPLSRWQVTGLSVCYGLLMASLATAAFVAIKTPGFSWKYW